MFWAGLIGNKMVGPFQGQGVKMNAPTCADFLKQNFVSWYYFHARQRTIACSMFHYCIPTEYWLQR